jgi:hypothetical protein
MTEKVVSLDKQTRAVLEMLDEMKNLIQEDKEKLLVVFCTEEDVTFFFQGMKSDQEVIGFAHMIPDSIKMRLFTDLQAEV